MDWTTILRQLEDPKILTYVLIFFVTFALALGFDMYKHRDHHHLGMKESLAWSAFYILIAVAFGGFTFWYLGPEDGGAYFSGWALEKTLAVDNLIAFSAVFAAFGMRDDSTDQIQHRILHYGILGALFFRVIFLGAMNFLLHFPSPYHEIVMGLFALAILYSVYKLLSGGDDDIDYTTHFSVRFVRRFYPVKASLEDGNFFVKEMDPKTSKIVRMATVSLLCLVCIEVVDIIFAFDSMPVIAVVTKSFYIMIPATMFAVLGLRALYFVLLELAKELWLLEKAIVLLLIWIIIKILLEVFHVYTIPNLWNLAVVGFFITLGVVLSLVIKEPQEVDSKEVNQQ